jgi:SAM-dependent methyltransferase
VVLDHAPGLLSGAAEDLAEKVRRGWWFAKAAMGFEARAVYADLYAPPQDLGRFDLVVLNGLFSELPHPYLALQRATEMTDTLVVMEPVFPGDARAGTPSPPVARFIPASGADASAHWQHTPAAIMLMLASVSFADHAISTHTLLSRAGQAIPYLVIVARRSTTTQIRAATVQPAAPPAAQPAAQPTVSHAVQPESRADELPLPSSAGRFSVAGTDNVETFVVLGRAGHAALESSLLRANVTPASLGRILDFGCGVGRVLRYWHGQKGFEMHGTDLNPDSIAWCKQNLSFANFKINGLEPQLDYQDAYFGFVYALSVFTHLPEAIQLPWLRELIRIIRPGGLLYFTTHGNSYRHALPANLLERYDRDEFVSGGDDQPGSNYCGTFHPPAYVRSRLLAPLGLELVEFLPEGAAGNPTQDSWLVRKPG